MESNSPFLTKQKKTKKKKNQHIKISIEHQTKPIPYHKHSNVVIRYVNWLQAFYKLKLESIYLYV